MKKLKKKLAELIAYYEGAEKVNKTCGDIEMMNYCQGRKDAYKELIAELNK